MHEDAALRGQREHVAVELPPVVIPAVEITDVVSLDEVRERPASLTRTVDEAIERLAGHLAAGHTVAFREALRFWSRFHKYSFANTLLIQAQRPDATLVAGFNRWRDEGFPVRKGERAMWIWAPMMRKNVNAGTGEEQEVVVAFRPAPVFDVAQVEVAEGQSLPSFFAPLPDDVDVLYQQVRARVEAVGIRVEERMLPAGVQGMSRGGSITIRPGLDSRNRLAVLLHEFVHEIEHQTEDTAAKTRGQRELEAESVTYVVLAVHGIEIPTSPDYVLTWDGTVEQLRASMSTIQRLVRRVLSMIEDTPSMSLAA